LVDGDGIFDTKAPNGSGPGETFTIEDTGGCSCEQIIDAEGLGQGPVKFGCSLGAMRYWVEGVGRRNESRRRGGFASHASIA
jgi:hypothetical protein